MPKFITFGTSRYSTDEVVKYRPYDDNKTGVTIRTTGEELVYPEPVDVFDRIMKEANQTPNESLIRQLIRSMDNLSNHIQRMPTSIRVKL